MSGSRRLALSALVAAAALSLFTTAGSATAAKVHLSFSSTEQLHVGEGSYEAWLLIGGIPRSLGKFNLDGDQRRIRDLQGNVITDNILTTNLDVTQATELWITTEPQGDNDSAPAYKWLAGNVSDIGAGMDSCTFNSKHANGMNVDFTNAAGSFLLTSPTTSTLSDSVSGVWFMTKCTAGAAASLTLPTLPTGIYGWQYQGWIADVNSTDAVPYSTGEFYSPSGADADGGGCAAGSVTPPAFPGSDFVVDNGLCTEGEPILPQFNDGGWSVVLTVEPNPNTGPLPFGFKPLQVGNITSGIKSCTSQTLTNFASNLPRGTATIVAGTTPVRGSSWGSVKSLYK